MTLAFSSPDVCCISLTLHSAHLFRGRAERRDCVLRAAGHRLAKRNRCAQCYAGPRRSRDFGSSVAAASSPQSLPRPTVSSSLPAPTSPPPLPHPSPFRRPGPHVRSLWDCADIRSLCKSRSLRYLSLQPFPVLLLSRLSACLLNFSGHPASRLTPSRRLSAKVRAIVLNVRLGIVADVSVFARSEGCHSKYIYSLWSRSSCAPCLRLSR